MKRLLFTTSWDDGHVLDMKLANLLDEYRAKGTFYISRNYTNKPLSAEDILILSQHHEIGAHTLSHPDLTALDDRHAMLEMIGGKKWLESITKKPVTTFCYPFGKYNERLTALAQQAGFIGARTVEKFDMGVNHGFNFGYTAHVYPFPFRKVDAQKYYWRYLFQPLQQNWNGIRKYNVSLLALRSWQSYVRALFELAVRQGNSFHLYGHSWEIEKYDMWAELETFLDYAQRSGKCYFVTNQSLLKRNVDIKNA